MPATAPVVHIDPDILGGTHGIDEFLDAFPTVSREQVVAALEAAHEANEHAHSSR
jgi:hypothetical protein